MVEKIKWFFKDIFTGWGVSGWLYVLFILSVYALTAHADFFAQIFPQLDFLNVVAEEGVTENWIHILSQVAGWAGTICVLLVAKGKLSNYVFGLIQVVLLLVIAWSSRLFGEFTENLMYIVAQFVGFKLWEDNLKEDDLVKTQKMSPKDIAVVFGITLLFTILFATLFSAMGGRTVWEDASTLVIAFVAQYLMLLRYREQWAIWVLLNLISLVQFYRLGNVPMLGMYSAFLINSIYGLVNWSRTAEKSLQGETSFIEQSKQATLELLRSLKRSKVS